MLPRYNVIAESRQNASACCPQDLSTKRFMVKEGGNSFTMP